MGDGLRVFLVPSERDKVNDPLRYFTAEVNGDGTFLFTNLPPARYWALAQQSQAEIPTSTEKLRLPDALEARANIRRAAEAAKVEVELNTLPKSDRLQTSSELKPNLARRVSRCDHASPTCYSILKQDFFVCLQSQ